MASAVPVPDSLSDCVQTSFSHKRNRLYCRKFNHEDARRRYAAGETLAGIARALGVSERAVKIAVDEKTRIRDYERTLAWMRAGVCPDCGQPATRFSKTRQLRCQECASKRRRRSVRVDGEGNLVAIRCFDCGEWLGQELFSPSRWKLSLARKGSRTCRACESRRRREYREHRKVPCVSCGQPCLPVGEKGARHLDSGLCRACYVAAKKHGR